MRTPARAIRTALGHVYAADEALLSFGPDGAQFLVDHGERVTIHRPEGTSIEAMHASLLGPVLGIVMVQRGRLTLHAGAVRLGDRVLAVAGPSGSGKSTLSAALHLEGFAFVTDDVLAIGDDARVTPSYPLVKLWPDAASALGLDPATIPVIEPGYEKLGLDVASAFDWSDATLGSVVVLGGPDERTELLSEADALIELVKVLYAPEALRASGRDAEHFDRLASIARTVPVVRMSMDRANSPKVFADRILQGMTEYF